MADSENKDITMQPDAGLGFKAEMAANNFLMGYWKQLVAILVTVLLTVLIYGQWANYWKNQQYIAAAEISNVTSGLVLGAGPNDEGGTIATANALMVVAEGMTGAAQAEAHIRAAELYRLGGDKEAQKGALESLQVSAEGEYAYFVETALANMELDNGDLDGGIARLKSLRTSQLGYFQEQASIQLAASLESLDKMDEARAEYDKFLNEFPDSLWRPEVEARRSALSGTK